MDFIRDGNDIPIESTKEMTKRIQRDYELMEESYVEKVGMLPQLYVLMHSNTGQFGNNDKVSVVNEACIYNLFQMNFNREGFSYNLQDSSIYDLTRMQAQAYWYTNHLLMRIKDDTKADITFMDGDLKKKKDWNVIQGACEFAEDKIILTSQSEGKGTVKLENSKNYKDCFLNVNLKGNKLGIQTVYLRADEECKNAIEITLDSNVLYLRQVENGKTTEVAQMNLDKLDGITHLSVEEDENQALIGEYKTEAKYA